MEERDAKQIPSFLIIAGCLVCLAGLFVAAFCISEWISDRAGFFLGVVSFFAVIAFSLAAIRRLVIALHRRAIGECI